MRRLGRRDLEGSSHLPPGATIIEGTKTDHGEPDAGRKAPVPATLAWMLEAQIHLSDDDCNLLFTIPRGRLSLKRTFYRDLWKPAQEASGLRDPP
jgi:hypothetical protein